MNFVSLLSLRTFKRLVLIFVLTVYASGQICQANPEKYDPVRVFSTLVLLHSADVLGKFSGWDDFDRAAQAPKLSHLATCQASAEDFRRRCFSWHGAVWKCIELDFKLLCALAQVTGVHDLDEFAVTEKQIEVALKNRMSELEGELNVLKGWLGEKLADRSGDFKKKTLEVRRLMLVMAQLIFVHGLSLSRCLELDGQGHGLLDVADFSPGSWVVARTNGFGKRLLLTLVGCCSSPQKIEVAHLVGQPPFDPEFA